MSSIGANQELKSEKGTMTISCAQGGQILAELSKKDGKSLTPLQIQKILYFANMLYIGENGEPLIRNKFLAWKHGPVVRELYERLKQYEIVSTKAFSDIKPITDKDKKPKKGYEKQVKVIMDAYSRWSKFSAWKLVQISHWEEGAWYKTKQGGEIDNALIWNEFNARYN